MGNISRCNKYCSLEKLSKSFEQPIKFRFKSLPGHIIKTVHPPKDIQADIDNFRKALKSKPHNGSDILKLIIQSLKKIRDGLPTLYTQYTSFAVSKQTLTVDTDVQKLMVNIANTRLYNKQIQLEIYTSKCDTFNSQLEKLVQYLNNENFPFNDNSIITDNVSSVEVDNTDKLASKVEGIINGLKKFLKSRRVKASALRHKSKGLAYDTVKSVVANLKIDLKYIKKHVQRAKQEHNEISNLDKIVKKFNDLAEFIKTYEIKGNFNENFNKHLSELKTSCKEIPILRSLMKVLIETLEKDRDGCTPNRATELNLLDIKKILKDNQNKIITKAQDTKGTLKTAIEAVVKAIEEKHIDPLSQF